MEDRVVGDDWQGCTHHWDIENSHGYTVEGVCRKCGERRSFVNGGDWTRQGEQDASERQRRNADMVTGLLTARHPPYRKAGRT